MGSLSVGMNYCIQFFDVIVLRGFWKTPQRIFYWMLLIFFFWEMMIEYDLVFLMPSWGFFGLHDMCSVSISDVISLGLGFG